jgi:outer membrane protein assembly factor BamE (lipoprotein component of BamABCDE complex)
MLHSLVQAAKRRRLFLAATVVALLVAMTASAFAQGPRRTSGQKEEENTTAFHEYRGIQLGMLAEEVRKKLGSPTDKGDEQDFYVFNDAESAQIIYDRTHKVTAISADFSGAGATVPTAKQVLGADIEAKPDGSMYKMMRFPKAGYWLSFNRTAGTSPVTSVTLQKIQ